MRVTCPEKATNSTSFALPSARTLPRLRPSSSVSLRTNASRKFGSFDSLRFRFWPHSKIVKASIFEGTDAVADVLSRTECADLPVQICETRTLSPALTLRDGVAALRKAIVGLKADPPCSKNGILRYQLAVPPNIKALDWVQSQPQPPKILPQLYFSKLEEKKFAQESSPSLEVVGLSGIGAAVYFEGSDFLNVCMKMKRYLSADSPFIKAYGFRLLKQNKGASEKCHVNSYYLFIPQIELDEFDDVSLIAVTMAWDEFSHYNFEKAVLSVEHSLDQIAAHVMVIKDASFGRWMYASNNNLGLQVESSAEMVILSENSDSVKTWNDNGFITDKSSSCCDYFFQSTMASAFSRHVDFQDNGPVSLAQTLNNCVNINSLWATLIVEECCRLGLTYFCIAPGSRSSPLTVAATSHPNTTCISCFDERSLAYHAIGYARGSCKPAIVITSSGTAVSNLLPAVVEASEDFIPLLLLTADRPPELQDVGANQAIDQVKHFGSFVRYFFNLPAPDDQIPAKMVLTTIDSAVHHIIQSPSGPVHINCAFREPLHDSPKAWDSSCLVGLDLWNSTSNPFTKYIDVANSPVSNDVGDISWQIKEVFNLVQHANRGLLVIGGIHSEADIWATLLLSEYLCWPVIPDILSGIRMRKVFTTVQDAEKKFLFVDYLDHALLAESVRSWMKPDVVVQIGSRLTSKRIAGMLETCNPQSYIMVEKHPFRHDPSHIITHRIQSNIVKFAALLLKFVQPGTRNSWCNWLHTLNATVALETSFQMHIQESLTEPFVAKVVSESLYSDVAVFLGNSMVIRDMENYAPGWLPDAHDTSNFPNWGFPSIGVRVAGNRGASGIDGLLSTAIGFAVGSKKRVVALIGDVSFLHDTNGLAILNERIMRKPMTILVINNRGGAIFSLLPIAKRIPARTMERYFYTSHSVKIAELCAAHGVKHLQVQTKKELQDALILCHQDHSDCVIEVISSIEKNAAFHRKLEKFACQAAESALAILSRVSDFNSCSNNTSCKIWKMEYSLYRIQLSAPTTATKVNDRSERFYKEGFILMLHLETGSVGIGEVSPMEIHKEDLVDVEEQLRFLCHRMQGMELSYLLPLLRGSFASWIWSSIGVQPSTIFPSVRSGLEMASLNAIAAAKNSSMSDMMLSCMCSGNTKMDASGKDFSNVSRVQICALVDSNGSAEDVIQRVVDLVNNGFTTVKLKVARRANPLEDAVIVQEIRKKVGHQINIRVDANRMWSLEEAIEFGTCVADHSLQYIEEPVQFAEDIIKFCEKTCLPVALDETVDDVKGDPNKLTEFVHPGIVAVIIKPSCLGGFENSALVAQWAQQHGKMAIISGAFESSISLSAYVHFAFYVDKKSMDINSMCGRGLIPATAHGLGTFQWLQEDVVNNPLKFIVHPHGNSVEASVEDAKYVLHNFQINYQTVQNCYTEETFSSYSMTVQVKDIPYSLHVLDTLERNDNNEAIVFFHGFLGTADDWTPVMKAISATRRCISFDLPGHGKSLPEENDLEVVLQGKSSLFEQFMDELFKVIHQIIPGKVVLVGYSMGARLALYMALRYSEKIAKAVIISGNPGLRDPAMRKHRAAHDEVQASYLAAHGLECFLEYWYTKKLWDSFRSHPLFEKISRSRLMHDDVNALATSLSIFSIGKQPSLWEDLKHCKVPLLFIVGEKDRKFRKIAEQMYAEVSTRSYMISDSTLNATSHSEDCKQITKLHEILVVPDCGHAVHLESPLPVINAIRKFSDGLKVTS